MGVNSISFETGVPANHAGLTFTAQSQGPAQGASTAAVAQAHIYSVGTIFGTTLEHEVESKKLQKELNQRFGAAKAVLVGAYSNATNFRFNFARSTVAFQQGAKQRVVGFEELQTKLTQPQFQTLQDLLDTAIKINPAFKKRNHQPIAHSVGERFGSRHVSRANHPVHASLNKRITPSAQMARALPEYQQSKKPVKQRMDQRIKASSLMYTRLTAQVKAKVKSLENRPKKDKDRQFWTRVHNDLLAVDRPALMMAATLMPDQRTSKAIARAAEKLANTSDQEYRRADDAQRHDGFMARHVLNGIDENSWFSGLRGLRMANDLPGSDPDYAIDRGAILFSGLPAAKGRVPYAAYYAQHRKHPKQESVTGLVLRAAVCRKDRGAGLKSAWAAQLGGSAPQVRELSGMIDQAHQVAWTRANARSRGRRVSGSSRQIRALNGATAKQKAHTSRRRRRISLPSPGQGTEMQNLASTSRRR